MDRISILFLCVGNSCRSQMAEGWAKKLLAESAVARQLDIRVRSAGTDIKPVNAKAIAVMAERGVDISGQYSKLLSKEQLANADWIITLCDQLKGHCLSVPNSVNRRHWGLKDPASNETNPGGDVSVFREVRDLLREQIDQFVAELESLSEWENVCFKGQDVEVRARQSEYRGFFEIQQLTLRHRLYEGGWSEFFNRELFVRELAVVVMLFDPVRDELVLIEQFRVGAIEDNRSAWLTEMVAGIVEPGEKPEQVAHREAMEEAGCRIGELIKLYDYWTSPGGSNERVIIYCGRVDATDIGGIHGLKHEHEDICVKVVPCDWAFSAVERGIINNAATIIALQWLQLNKDHLMSKWQ